MIQNMNKALEYIELNLDNEITDDHLEKITGTSIYHFQRIFSFLSGMTLNEYIRKRKLSKATTDLLEGMSVTATAFKYGYGSVDGFSRAYKEWAGVIPSKVQEKNVLKSFPKLSFQLTIKGGVNMDYRIEKKDAFKIVGVKKRIPIQFEGTNQEIIKLAQSITAEQRNKMHSYANVEPNQVVNASFNFDDGRMKERGELDHMIGVLTTEEDDFTSFDIVEVPELTWAIFSSTGEFPKVMQETWGKIAAEWLPSSGYELVKAPEISFTGDLSDRDHVYSEIWLAVRKKS